jgi:putative Mg2+ transporter-C (MgtC) family protein
MPPIEEIGEIAVRLLAAVLCGGLIGWNREREDKPAGLRTHMLVSLGAASFTLECWT